jgi:HPt (histidine-containing phosphotransfer) domain-containing protein
MTLVELQQRFLTGLERRLGEIANALAGTHDPESLMLMFHSLAGIAGTFGFHRITDISRECEEFCVSATSDARALTAEDIGRLQRSVEAIREAREFPALSPR